MDIGKLWSLISNHSLGASVCPIPTTYYIQEAAPASSVAFPVQSTITADEETSNLDNESLTDDEYDDSQSSSSQACDNDGKKQKRSNRTRYLREEYRCTSCQYSCTTENAFLRHLRKCGGKEDGKKEGPKLSCPICGRDRKTEDSLEIHMKKHKDDKNFCCDLCRFRTLQLKKLIQHRRMHTGEKPHLCPFCSYRSSRRDNLRSHVRRVHKKELICDTFTPRTMVVTPSKIKN